MFFFYTDLIIGRSFTFQPSVGCMLNSYIDSVARTFVRHDYAQDGASWPQDVRDLCLSVERAFGEVCYLFTAIIAPNRSVEPEARSRTRGLLEIIR